MWVILPWVETKCPIVIITSLELNTNSVRCKVNVRWNSNVEKRTYCPECKGRLVLTNNLQSKQLQNSTETITLYKILILDWTSFLNASVSCFKVKSSTFRFCFFFLLFTANSRQRNCCWGWTNIPCQTAGWFSQSYFVALQNSNDIHVWPYCYCTCDRPVFRTSRDFSGDINPFVSSITKRFKLWNLAVIFPFLIIILNISKERLFTASTS